MIYKILINMFFNKKIFIVRIDDLNCMCTMREGCLQCNYVIFHKHLLTENSNDS